MEFTAKTVDEAVKQALAELNATEDMVDVVVKEQPTKGLFGFLKGKAVVEVTLKKVEEPAKKDNEEKAVELVENVLKYLGINATATLGESNDRTVITLNSEDSSSLIGYRGEVLDALQTLAGAMANIGNKVYKKVVVDCENYRDKREETLIKLAHKLESKATEIRREVVLEPMSPFERRIIHTALAESQTVTTTSKGNEPNRYVVIVPNDKDEFAKPYNAGRNNDRRGGKRERNDRRGGKRDFKGKRDFRGDRKSNGSSAPKKKTTITFGTYLGNSLKGE